MESILQRHNSQIGLGKFILKIGFHALTIFKYKNVNLQTLFTFLQPLEKTFLIGTTCNLCFFYFRALSITNNCCQLLSSSVSVSEAEDDDNEDIPWELIDPDNWLEEPDSYIENQELVEAKLAVGALDYVAAAISRKVS